MVATSCSLRPAKRTRITQWVHLLTVNVDLFSNMFPGVYSPCVLNLCLQMRRRRVMVMKITRTTTDLRNKMYIVGAAGWGKIWKCVSGDYCIIHNLYLLNVFTVKHIQRCSSSICISIDAFVYSAKYQLEKINFVLNQVFII